jgi:tetracycline 7-halogenase / FADH2 O2-dependent halogenase
MMTYDIAIIGSGMAGSVTAVLLSKLGYKTLLIEKDSHPRFALGESSTPPMNKKVRYLGRLYDIPEFIDISTYDNIMTSSRPFLCGPKELFYYFYHEPDQTKAKVNEEYREIAVQLPRVETHFLRAELDMRLVEYAQKYGTEYVDHTKLLDVNFGSDGAVLRLQKQGSDIYDVGAKFVIDGTGFRSLLSTKLNLRLPEQEVDTPLRSRSIFTHYENVGRLETAVEDDEKFNRRIKVDRVRGTQHHCFDGGWYWFIPFDNGVTSVGVNLDMDKYPMNDVPGEEEFWQITDRYPIIRSMLENRKTIMPYIKTGRLQFRTRYAAGDRWALLPAAATGADAWFSTGMGLNMIATHRLVHRLHTTIFAKNQFDRKHLEHYETALFKEWWYITRMVDGIYKSFKHYEIFKWYCFFCFMGAESLIHTGGLKRPDDPTALHLNVGDQEFTKRFLEIYAKILECYNKDAITPMDSELFRRYLQNEMKPYNYRDYGNPIYQGIHYRLSEDSPFYY